MNLFSYKTSNIILSLSGLGCLFRRDPLHYIEIEIIANVNAIHMIAYAAAYSWIHISVAAGLACCQHEMVNKSAITTIMGANIIIIYRILIINQFNWELLSSWLLPTTSSELHNLFICNHSLPLRTRHCWSIAIAIKHVNPSLYRDG